MKQQLLAGTGKIDITPPPGVQMGGYGVRIQGAEGTHDPLWAKALTLSVDDTAIALVSCDLLGLTADVLDPVRAQIAEQCGIPADRVMVVCTHTHAGPDTLRLFPNEPSPEYFRSVQQGIVDAVTAAHSHLRPAQAGWGRGNAPGISLNRRKFEQGPLDTEVGVLRVEDHERNPMALVANFACHPVALGGNNLLYSADFPGFAMNLLEQIDPGCLAIFTNGAFGNVNTGHRPGIDVGDRGERTFERARALGHMLAGEVLKVHNALQCQPEVTLSAATQRLALPTRPLPHANWDELRAVVTRAQEVVADPATPHEDKVKAQVGTLYQNELLRLKESLPSEIGTEVAALRIGDGVLAGVPAEYFIEYQIALKQASALPFTFLVGLANDWIGYVPARDAFDDGGYETDLARWSKMAPECGDLIYEALLDTVRRASA